MFDKARFAAAGRAFEDYRQVSSVRGFKQADFVIDRQVIWLFSDFVFFDSAFGHKLVNRKS